MESKTPSLGTFGGGSMIKASKPQAVVTTEASEIGNLSVSVIEARGLVSPPAAGPYGLSPHAKIKYDGAVEQTSTQSTTRTPVWDQEYLFSVRDRQFISPVRIELWSGLSFIGATEIYLRDKGVSAGRHRDEWFTMSDKDNERLHGCEIRLRLEYNAQDGRNAGHTTDERFNVQARGQGAGGGAAPPPSHASPAANANAVNMTQAKLGSSVEKLRNTHDKLCRELIEHVKETFRDDFKEFLGRSEITPDVAKAWARGEPHSVKTMDTRKAGDSDDTKAAAIKDDTSNKVALRHGMAVLKLGVVQGKDLIAMDTERVGFKKVNTNSDPFVQCFFYPNGVENSAERHELFTTHTVYGDCSPQWSAPSNMDAALEPKPKQLRAGKKLNKDRFRAGCFEKGCAGRDPTESLRVSMTGKVSGVTVKVVTSADGGGPGAFGSSSTWVQICLPRPTLTADAGGGNANWANSEGVLVLEIYDDDDHEKKDQNGFIAGLLGQSKNDFMGRVEVRLRDLINDADGGRQREVNEFYIVESRGVGPGGTKAQRAEDKKLEKRKAKLENGLGRLELQMQMTMASRDEEEKWEVENLKSDEVREHWKVMVPKGNKAYDPDGSLARELSNVARERNCPPHYRRDGDVTETLTRLAKKRLAANGGWFAEVDAVVGRAYSVKKWLHTMARRERQELVRVQDTGEDFNNDLNSLFQHLYLKTVAEKKVATLEVSLVEAFSLQVADLLYSDPYAVVSIDGKVVGRTHHILNTLAPNWNVKFEVPITNMTGTKVLVQVFDYDQYNADDFLGQCELDLTDIISGRWTAETNAQPPKSLKNNRVPDTSAGPVPADYRQATVATEEETAQQRAQFGAWGWAPEDYKKKVKGKLGRRTLVLAPYFQRPVEKPHSGGSDKLVTCDAPPGYLCGVGDHNPEGPSVAGWYNLYGRQGEGGEEKPLPGYIHIKMKWRELKHAAGHGAAGHGAAGHAAAGHAAAGHGHESKAPQHGHDEHHLHDAGHGNSDVHEEDHHEQHHNLAEAHGAHAHHAMSQHGGVSHNHITHAAVGGHGTFATAGGQMVHHTPKRGAALLNQPRVFDPSKAMALNPSLALQYRKQVPLHVTEDQFWVEFQVREVLETLERQYKTFKHNEITASEDVNGIAAEVQDVFDAPFQRHERRIPVGEIMVQVTGAEGLLPTTHDMDQGRQTREFRERVIRLRIVGDEEAEGNQGMDGVGEGESKAAGGGGGADGLKKRLMRAKSSGNVGTGGGGDNYGHQTYEAVVPPGDDRSQTDFHGGGFDTAEEGGTAWQCRRWPECCSKEDGGAECSAYLTKKPVLYDYTAYKVLHEDTQFLSNLKGSAAAGEGVQVQQRLVSERMQEARGDKPIHFRFFEEGTLLRIEIVDMTNRATISRVGSKMQQTWTSGGSDEVGVGFITIAFAELKRMLAEEGEGDGRHDQSVELWLDVGPDVTRSTFSTMQLTGPLKRRPRGRVRVKIWIPEEWKRTGHLRRDLRQLAPAKLNVVGKAARTKVLERGRKVTDGMVAMLEQHSAFARKIRQIWHHEETAARLEASAKGGARVSQSRPVQIKVQVMAARGFHEEARGDFRRGGAVAFPYIECHTPPGVRNVTPIPGGGRHAQGASRRHTGMSGSMAAGGGALFQPHTVTVDSPDVDWSDEGEVFIFDVGDVRFGKVNLRLRSAEGPSPQGSDPILGGVTLHAADLYEMLLEEAALRGAADKLVQKLGGGGKAKAIQQEANHRSIQRLFADPTVAALEEVQFNGGDNSVEAAARVLRTAAHFPATLRAGGHGDRGEGLLDSEDHDDMRPGHLDPNGQITVHQWYPLDALKGTAGRGALRLKVCLRLREVQQAVEIREFNTFEQMESMLSLLHTKFETMEKQLESVSKARDGELWQLQQMKTANAVRARNHKRTEAMVRNNNLHTLSTGGGNREGKTGGGGGARGGVDLSDLDSDEFGLEAEELFKYGADMEYEEPTLVEMGQESLYKNLQRELHEVNNSIRKAMMERHHKMEHIQRDHFMLPKLAWKSDELRMEQSVFGIKLPKTFALETEHAAYSALHDNFLGDVHGDDGGEHGGEHEHGGEGGGHGHTGGAVSSSSEKGWQAMKRV